MSNDLAPFGEGPLEAEDTSRKIYELVVCVGVGKKMTLFRSTDKQKIMLAARRLKRYMRNATSINIDEYPDYDEMNIDARNTMIALLTANGPLNIPPDNTEVIYSNNDQRLLAEDR